ncbi:MAG: hypothetical protein ACRYFV_13695 [Janthinobacterium lividum]
MTKADGSFNDTLVLITETFTAGDGSTVYATEEWHIYGYDDSSGEYLAYERDKSFAIIALTDQDLRGRAQIIED